MVEGFPMRPTMVDRLTPSNVLRLVSEVSATHIIQPKLNGDRVILQKANGRVSAWSRFGKPYSFSVLAAAEWASLPDGTMLDGEGWNGHFWPFEAVSDAPVEERVEGARQLCALVGRPFIFNAPDEAWLLRCAENAPDWEGIVAKERGSRYEWLGKPHRESWAWLKLKW